jgi:hypothetical protein
VVVVARRSSLRLAKQQVRKVAGRQLAFAISLRWVGSSIGSSFFSLVKPSRQLHPRPQTLSNGVRFPSGSLNLGLLTSSANVLRRMTQMATFATQSGYLESD